ncbi:hypothetical protein [Streptomyces sp. NBC_00102]|uniref:hypothetical protein n=1 Tax=Streptomyces sp. NBC_00102 TaxID=2975652 RepID=UPI00224D6763|nr:hypothetical protein [Streptomyces sp. NBC_00102]MCX5398913.1 hypothetical protein [Streptomyces sp. NBC_00102]
MDAGTAVGVVGAFALPLLTQRESLGRSLKFVFAALAGAAVAAGLLLGEAALGPTALAAAFSCGIVLQSWRTDALLDSLERERRGIPVLLKGDASTRGLFDVVCLVRYRVRMRKQPLTESGAKPAQS